MKNPDYKSITFLSDTPPLKTKGSGISVLLYHMLKALQGNFIINAITFCRETKATPTEIENDNSGTNIYICDKHLFKFYPLIKFGVFQKAFQFIAFIYSIPFILKRYNNAQNVFVTVVGASVKPICKAWIMMKVARKSTHCLYIVDDLELINKKYGNKFELFLIARFLKETIKQADVLITISKGLQDLYIKKYNKKSIVLLPHFKKTSPLLNSLTKNENEFVFLFTGGLNILYNESLKFFVSVIEELNNKNNNNLVFKLIVQTYSSFNDFKSLNLNDNYVSYSTSNNRDELLRVYEKCDCFLIPYSFAETDYGLITTSFPQKIAEIIQYGKKLLVFGPANSSVNLFFASNEINYRCETKSNALLGETINDILKNNIDINRYYRAYEKHLSAKNVIHVFDRVINNEVQ